MVVLYIAIGSVGVYAVDGSVIWCGMFHRRMKDVGLFEASVLVENRCYGDERSVTRVGGFGFESICQLTRYRSELRTTLASR